MILGNAFLSYCTNIHPGKSWDDTRRNILTHCPEIKRAVAPDQLFGLGIWLSSEAAAGLKKEQGAFKKKLNELGMFVFSVNAFPYGDFHGRQVKQRVYTPDWSTSQRLEYTREVAEILAMLLPEETDGSISTVPVAYGKQCPDGAMENLLSLASHLERIEKVRGSRITLAIEPEPDCFLENTQECINFFRTLTAMDSRLTKRYLGICLDTCHMALQFENPTTALEKLTAAGIRIPKIQLSSALKLKNPQTAGLQWLQRFDDGVYLHQTRIRKGKNIRQYPDLPEAISSAPAGEWRVHFHVPLHYTDHRNDTNGPHDLMGTTSDLLDRKFFETAGKICWHYEIETYAFNVMPEYKKSLHASIIEEYAFVLQNMGLPLTGAPNPSR